MSLEDFQAKLEEGGWMTNPDGEDLCRSCWTGYLAQFSEEHQGMIREDSRSTASLAETRRLRDCWHTMCEKCSVSVYSSY